MQQVPRAGVASPLPEVIAPSDQPGQEVSSFSIKQRLPRQRLFSKTCFDCRCTEVSHKCAVPLLGAGVPQEQAGWDTEKLLVQGWGAERGSSAGSGVMLAFGGIIIIYGAILQPLLFHPCTPLVCQLERTFEAPPVSQEAREELQEGLVEAFLALVRENAREEVLLDVEEGRNCSDSIQEVAGKVWKQRATGTNSQPVPLPVGAAQSSYTEELLPWQCH